MTLSQDDKDVYEMYVDFLIYALCDITKVSFSSASVYFDKGVSLDADCDGGFLPSTYICDMEIEITIPVDSILPALREDIEITIIHEFAHYEHHVKLRTPVCRLINASKYFTDENFRWKEEQRAWRRTRDLAKELDLWNCKTMRRCLAADASAVAVKEYE